MKTAGKTIALVVAGAITLSACETNEKTGQLFGSILGAGLGLAVAGDDDDTVKALAVVAGAGLGAWIGGNIGRGLDQKERERVAMSTQNVLDAQVPANSPIRRQGEAQPAQTATYAPSASWTSPTNPTTVSGKSTLVQVSGSAGGGECRTVRQLVVKNGAESSEDVKFCRQSASAQWQPAQA